MITKQSAGQLLQEFEETLAWIRSLGINLSIGRLSHYNKIAKLWTDIIEGKITAGHNFNSELISTVFEVPTFIDIYHAFKSTDCSSLNGLISKLEKAVDGPNHLSEENPASSTARNFLFEAIVTAKLHNPSQGLNAILDAPSDVGILFNKKKIWVECKRVSSEKKLRANISKACKQLKTTLEKHPQIGQRGLIAIDISKLITQPPPNFVFETEFESQIDEYSKLMLDEFIRANSSIWQETMKSHDERIVGTLLRLQIVATSREKNTPIYVAQWGINPRLNISLDDQRLMKDIVTRIQSVSVN